MNPTTSVPEKENRRILVIDDNPAIHEDFRKILCPVDSELVESLDATEASRQHSAVTFLHKQHRTFHRPATIRRFIGSSLTTISSQ